MSANWYDGLTLEQVIARLKELRDKWDEAEADFIRACMMVEESGLWESGRGPKDVTFSRFLDRMGVCDEARYNRSAAALRAPDLVQDVPVLGLAAAVAINEVRQPEQREKVREAMRGYAKDHNARVPERTARNIVDRLVGGKVRVSSLDMANARIAELEKDLAAAHRKISELEKRLNERVGAEPEVPTKKRAVATSPKTPEKGARKPARK